MKRSAPIAAIVAVFGCNQIFGLDKTEPQDALVPLDFDFDGFIDAPMEFMGTVSLHYADQNPDGTPKISFPTPTMSPDLKAGLLTDTVLEAVPYVAGKAKVPNTLLGGSWRLLATLPTNGMQVVHEYQWTAEAAFHITAPIVYGHPDPAASPGPGAGYAIAPMAIGHAIARPELITSGVWTDVRRNPNPPTLQTFGVTWNDVTSESEPLVGPFGAPETARGDWQLLLERAVFDTICLRTIGSAWQQVDLMAATSMSTPSWRTATTQWTPPANYLGDENQVMRMNKIPPGAERRLSAFGYVPKDGVPGFVRRRRGLEVTDVASERPLMVSLAECTEPYTSPIAVVEEPMLAATMMPANYVELTSSRTIGARLVTSSFQAIALPSQPITLDAGIAQDVMIDTTSVSSTGPDFSMSVSVAGSEMIPVTWGRESGGVAVRPDAWEVTLFAVRGLTFAPIRVFHTVTERIALDPAAFAGVSDSDFVLKIVGIKGLPNATAGDFRTRTYPYSQSTLWTYGFRVTR